MRQASVNGFAQSAHHSQLRLRIEEIPSIYLLTFLVESTKINTVFCVGNSLMIADVAVQLNNLRRRSRRPQTLEVEPGFLR